jgi:hypothetical protein
VGVGVLAVVVGFCVGRRVVASRVALLAFIRPFALYERLSDGCRCCSLLSSGFFSRWWLLLPGFLSQPPQFFSSTSSATLNVGFKMQRAIRFDVEHGLITPKMFDAAHREIYKLISLDVYPKYIAREYAHVMSDDLTHNM